jgi:hypothetical protein
VHHLGPVLETDAQLAGEVLRIVRQRIGLVLDQSGQRQHLLVGEHAGVELVDGESLAHQAGRDDVGQRELRGIGVRRPALGIARLADRPDHRFGHQRADAGNVAGPQRMP